MASLQRSIKRSKPARTLGAVIWLATNAAHLEELKKKREANAKQKGQAL